MPPVMTPVQFKQVLRNITGKQVLSGQQVAEDYRDPSPAKLFQLPEQPALLGVNWLVGDNDYVYNNGEPELTISHANNGGVVVVTIHFPNFWSSDQSLRSAWVADQEASKPDLKQLVSGSTASTQPAQRYRRAIDRIIAKIKALPPGTIVVFRPWHEINGAHFYWGLDKRSPARSAAGIIALWVDTIARVKAECPDILVGWSTGMSWFAGMDYGQVDMGLVDIVGASLYRDDVKFVNKFGDDYRTLVNTGRPVWLFEVGSDKGQKGITGFDARKITNSLAANYPAISGMVNWHGANSLKLMSNSAALLADPRVLNLTDLRPPTQVPVGAVWAERDPGVRLTAVQTATNTVKIPVWPS
jgi:beta-mannanase